jgi:hypothetical protein
VWLVLAASILFGFPLAMLGLKDSCISLLETATTAPPSRGAHPTAPSRRPVHSFLRALCTTHQDALTLGLLSAVVIIAILVMDIGLVVGISGALLGSSIVYIFPALIFSSARLKQMQKTKSSVRPEHSLPPIACALLPLRAGPWVLLATPRAHPASARTAAGRNHPCALA